MVKLILKILLVSICSASWSGCAGLTSRSRTRTDSFEQVKVDEMLHNAISPRPFERSRVYLNPRRETRPDGTAVFFLNLQFYSVTEFTAAPGENLILDLNGKRYGLTATNVMTAVKTKPGYAAINYEIPPQLLADLANAKTAALRLRGAPNSIEKKLSNFNKKRVKRFLIKNDIAQFVQSGASGPASKTKKTPISKADPKTPEAAGKAAIPKEPVSKLEPNPQH